MANIPLFTTSGGLLASIMPVPAASCSALQRGCERSRNVCSTLTVRVQARVMLPFIGRLAVEHADGVLVEADASARSPLVPLPP